MNRRAFVTGLGAVLAVSRVVEAQQAGRLHRVVFLAVLAVPDLVDALRQGLRELGWIEGHNYVLDPGILPAVFSQPADRVDQRPQLSPFRIVNHSLEVHNDRRFVPYHPSIVARWEKGHITRSTIELASVPSEL